LHVEQVGSWRRNRQVFLFLHLTLMLRLCRGGGESEAVEVDRHSTVPVQVLVQYGIPVVLCQQGKLDG